MLGFYFVTGTILQCSLVVSLTLSVPVQHFKPLQINLTWPMSIHQKTLFLSNNTLVPLSPAKTELELEVLSLGWSRKLSFYVQWLIVWNRKYCALGLHVFWRGCHLACLVLLWSLCSRGAGFWLHKVSGAAERREVVMEDKMQEKSNTSTFLTNLTHWAVVNVKKNTI